jgi:hypothetical protein
MTNQKREGSTRLGRISLEDAIAAGVAITGETRDSVENFLKKGLDAQHRLAKLVLARRGKTPNR